MAASKLTKLYRKLSGLIHIDVEKYIAKYDEDKKPWAYRRLIWNIPRGVFIRFAKRYTEDLAYIICNLAILTGLDIESDDIIPDNVINLNDILTKRDLDFAHKIIKDCLHFNKVLDYLMSEEEDYFICEGDEYIKIAIDTK